MSPQRSPSAAPPPRVRSHRARAWTRGRRGVARLGLLALLACGLAGCATTPDKLPRLERKFYDNLEAPEDRTAFLRLESAERQAFLEDRGLWARWLALSVDERASVERGEVTVGQQEFVAFMAWGPPGDTQRREADNRTVDFHTFIRCTSGPRRNQYVRSNLDCDGTSSEVIIAVEDGRITEIKFPN